MSLHPRQRIALQHPCTRAPDTLTSRYLAVEARDGHLLATILTINK